jgi:hypothetical protein
MYLAVFSRIWNFTAKRGKKMAPGKRIRGILYCIFPEQGPEKEMRECAGIKKPG